jgi:biotin carboxyl carrier protein
MADQALTLKAEPREGGGWRLLSPGVGLYASAPKEGSMFRAGESSAYLVILDRAFQLQLPAGVSGFVCTPPPELKHLPVEYGELLFELIPSSVEGVELGESNESEVSPSGLPVLRSPQAGRFYRNPDPDSPPFAVDGDLLAAGKTVGLLEVMKTFNPVKYQVLTGLPEKARVVRFLVGDSTDVEEGQALLELEAI